MADRMVINRGQKFSSAGFSYVYRRITLPVHFRCRAWKTHSSSASPSRLVAFSLRLRFRGSHAFFTCVCFGTQCARCAARNQGPIVNGSPGPLDGPDLTEARNARGQVRCIYARVHHAIISAGNRRRGASSESDAGSRAPRSGNSESCSLFLYTQRATDTREGETVVHG